MEAAIVALIATVGAIVVAKINREDSKKNTEKVLSKLQTNHGMEPFQYLEMVAEVKNEVIFLGARVDAYMAADEKAHEVMRHQLSRLSERADDRGIAAVAADERMRAAV